MQKIDKAKSFCVLKMQKIACRQSNRIKPFYGRQCFPFWVIDKVAGKETLHERVPGQVVVELCPRQGWRYDLVHLN